MTRVAQPVSLVRGSAFWVLLIVLVVSGLGHRYLLGQINLAMDRVITPVEPMASIPLSLGPWEGRDLPLEERIQRISGDDDFVNRIYTHRETGEVVSLYIGYIGKPRSWLGHRPDVCYRAFGFEERGQRPMQVTLENGRFVPAILYEFAQPRAGARRQVVMGTYLRNGRFLRAGDNLEQMTSRRPNLFSQQVTYLARIQVGIAASGELNADETVLTDFVRRVIPEVVQRMPQENRE